MDPRRDSPLRVLVVEDNPDGRDSLRLLLELSGYQVEVAGDGPAGLHKGLTWRPDAALIDLGLPLLGGHLVARQLREQLGDSVRLIAVTAYGSAWDRDVAFLSGFDVHIPKPADPEGLLRTLERECAATPPRPEGAAGGLPRPTGAPPTPPAGPAVRRG